MAMVSTEKWPVCVCTIFSSLFILVKMAVAMMMILSVQKDIESTEHVCAVSHQLSRRHGKLSLAIRHRCTGHKKG
eukprot:6735158-Ditylum_brightwellii.AAC.1